MLLGVERPAKCTLGELMAELARLDQAVLVFRGRVGERIEMFGDPVGAASYTLLRAPETKANVVCRPPLATKLAAMISAGVCWYASCIL